MSIGIPSKRRDICLAFISVLFDTRTIDQGKLSDWCKGKILTSVKIKWEFPQDRVAKWPHFQDTEYLLFSGNMDRYICGANAYFMNYFGGFTGKGAEAITIEYEQRCVAV